MAALGTADVGIAVPRLLDAKGALIPSMRREPTLVRALADALLGASRAGRWGRLGEVITDPDSYGLETTSDWAEGSTQLVSAACLARCGPWDESFFLYSEETDFHLRAGRAGFSVRYVPAATATHLEGDSARSPRLWSLLVANRLELYRRHHRRSATALYWVVLLMRETSRAALGRAPSRAAARTLLSPTLLLAERGPGWLESVRT
jgi:N-acetylglucosaminyl-diphospho-decaprenol L-rhamnosyltransferase